MFARLKVHGIKIAGASQITRTPSQVYVDQNTPSLTASQASPKTLLALLAAVEHPSYLLLLVLEPMHGVMGPPLMTSRSDNAMSPKGLVD